MAVSINWGPLAYMTHLLWSLEPRQYLLQAVYQACCCGCFAFVESLQLPCRDVESLHLAVVLPVCADRNCTILHPKTL